MKPKQIFFHPMNDFTGSTRALANMIESEYDGMQYIITIDSKGFLSSVKNVKIIPIYYPLYRERRIPIITTLIWKLHAIILTIIYGWAFETFYINTIIPYYPALLGKLLGKRIIYHIHEKIIDPSLSIKISEFIFNHIRADRIFVSNYVMGKYPVKSNIKSYVKYNKLPLSFTQKVHYRSLSNRKRNNIILISSLSISKGLFTYVELAKLMPNLNFTLVLSAQFQAINNFFKFKLPDNINILPTQSDIHPILYQSDLLLSLTIPSLSIETYGMTIVEAMAYGIPSIVPNVGGPTEIVENNYNGFCVDVTDIDILESKIRYILDEKNYERFVHNSLVRLNDFIAENEKNFNSNVNL